MAVRLKPLIGKLNDTTRLVLNDAAGLCLSRTHYDIDVEHYLLKLMETSDSDGTRIFRHFGVDSMRLSADLNKHLDRLKNGNGRTPTISRLVVDMLTEAWLLGSLNFNMAEIRTGLTILALLSREDLARVMRGLSSELHKIDPEALDQHFLTICAGSTEDATAAAAAAP